MKMLKYDLNKLNEPDKRCMKDTKGDTIGLYLEYLLSLLLMQTRLCIMDE
jgi:hypothetical protein